MMEENRIDYEFRWQLKTVRSSGLTSIDIVATLIGNVVLGLDLVSGPGNWHGIVALLDINHLVTDCFRVDLFVVDKTIAHYQSGIEFDEL